jgi:ATP-dependent RNA helicase DDX23/PRP28
MEDFMRRKPAAETVICFVNAKKSCDYVSQLISSHGYSSTVLHGGKTQDQREVSQGI